MLHTTNDKQLNEKKKKQQEKSTKLYTQKLNTLIALKTS